MEAGERAENLERQAEEAEALAAIYGDDFVREGDGGTVWEIRVPLGDPDDPDERRRQSDDAMLTRDGTPAPDCLVARVVPIETYPSRTPPLVEVHPVGALIQHRMDAALAAMDEEHVAADGDVCVFPFVTRLREMARAWRDEDRPSRRPGRDDDAAADADDDDDDAPGTGRGEEAETRDAEWDPAAIDAELASLAMTTTERGGARDGTAGTAGADATDADHPGVGAWTDESVERSIVAGPPFTEKKSTFRGFLLRDVTSLEQVDAMLRALRRDSRIARCSHLMAAWRIALRGDPRDPDCVWAQDHDEDGETGAGRGMSHLLRVTGSGNVCVVVARWFGGVHLGPARFQLINNCARDMLERCGFVQVARGGGKGGGKSKGG